MASPQMSLNFKVHRHEPELIAPAQHTANELLLLSDIDDQETLRIQMLGIQIYTSNPLMKGVDPAKVIKEGIAKALVFYYPFAGRLKEGPGRKLMVDCTGEGIIFIEADADVTLQQFGDALHPPFPCLEELIFDVPGSSGILGCPLLLVQVTRLRCGGFIMAFRFNHTMADAPGCIQFIHAIGEMARGEAVPSILPVWERHLLLARDPPNVTRIHPEYENVRESTKGAIMGPDDMVVRSFFFGPTEMAVIRKGVPSHLQNCSTIEVLAAYLWKLRAIALELNPEEEMSIIFTVSAREKLNFDIPNGYYGNTFAYRIATTTSKELIEKPLGFALEKVREMKGEVDGEYMKSVADLMVLKGRPPIKLLPSTYAVSDVTRTRFKEVDFGWGKAAYGGPVVGGATSFVSFYLRFKNNKGEDGIMVPIYLPPLVMDRFVQQLDFMLKDQQQHPINKSIVSSL